MIADNTPAARAAAFGTELIEVHDWLRQALRRLRAEMDTPGELTGARGRTLLAHCTGFCSALSGHQTSEDRTEFPALAAQAPELGPLLRELQRDHEAIAGILHRVEALADEASPGNLPEARAELDGLAAILESHFRWEERRIVDALNALKLSGATAGDLFSAPLRG